jgi:hypothetical protein
MILASLLGSIMEIVYIVGAIIGIWCVFDLFVKKNIDLPWKIVIAILILITSWIGLVIYLLFVRNQIPNK